jgi:protein-tyrosine phosphatase
MNVDPYVQNRVPLKVPEGHSDYINASFIKLQNTISGTNKEFIATQGPKEGIYGHVWRMIWHECSDPAVIVMLTQIYESGREKCFQYFPFDMTNPILPINEEDEFEDGFIATLTLKNITEDKATSSTIREMELATADGETKTVWHMLFGGWPDYSIPEGEDINGLVRLVDFSASKNPTTTTPNPSPRIVHCSAGVGRTGTFIALDWLLAEFREGRLDKIDDDVDPIADVVEELRGQRMMMVQGEQQFSFLYDVMRQLWLDRGSGDDLNKLALGGVSLSPEEKLRAEFEQEMKGNAERM